MTDNEAYAIKSNYVEYRQKIPGRFTSKEILDFKDSERVISLFAKTVGELGEGYYIVPVSLEWVHPTSQGISIDVGAKNADLITVSRASGIMDSRGLWVPNPETPLNLTAKNISAVALRGFFMPYDDEMVNGPAELDTDQ